ncbi:MAG: right-handed parallel beta-helix repeat-containing protein [Deltaproteobacteria bacterium]|nr:right-handed parallel beta-helix repeat-containing protein [Deltaproteobacteria bacterium]
MTIEIHSIARRRLIPLLLSVFVTLAAGTALAFPKTLNDWQDRYGAISSSGDSASCQLCHGNDKGGSPWNGYGWDMRDALADLSCDLDGDNDVSNDEAFFCIEMLNSDNNVGDAITNIDEIGLNAQPGWTEGPNNTLYTQSGTIDNVLPPDGIGKIDPDGSEPPPPPPPPPPGDIDDIPPGQMTRGTIVVKPGQSIQRAIDLASHGTRIYVLGGTYREIADPTNGLVIKKSGIRLIGQSNKKKRVVLENAGNQRNGIVIVPPEVEDCMSCHSDLAFPFPLHDWVPSGLPPAEPIVFDVEVRGITIKGFRNNGLFTERVQGFHIEDVESIDNPGYGIFPTLSSNGVITNSRASGSDDSGIWVETSENVVVTHNLVEGNVNGIEISNSENVLIAHNEARNNTVGIANLLLPDIFDDRPGSRKIDLKDNWLHDNNKPNTARPGSVLAFVPPGIGILHLGVDDSVISNNVIENNDFSGITVADYCATVQGTPFDCASDPSITPEFLADQAATNNTVVDNVLLNNGSNPLPGHPFAPLAADIILLTLGEWGNCFDGNEPPGFTFFSTLGVLPPCP